MGADLGADVVGHGLDGARIGQVGVHRDPGAARALGGGEEGVGVGVLAEVVDRDGRSGGERPAYVTEVEPERHDPPDEVGGLAATGSPASCREGFPGPRPADTGSDGLQTSQQTDLLAFEKRCTRGK